MESYVLTYYDDFAGINSDISKMTKGVEEYVTGFLEEVQAEVDHIQQSKAEAKSKQRETKAPVKGTKVKHKPQPKTESKLEQQETKPSKKAAKVEPKQDSKAKAKAKQQKTKTPQKEDSDDDEMEDVFARCFTLTESKPYVKENVSGTYKVLVRNVVLHFILFCFSLNDMKYQYLNLLIYHCSTVPLWCC